MLENDFQLNPKYEYNLFLSFNLLFHNHLKKLVKISIALKQLSLNMEVNYWGFNLDFLIKVLFYELKLD